MVELWWAEENGNLAAVLGPDPVGVLVDGFGVFKRALEATIAADRAIADAKDKAKLDAMRARQGRSGG